MSGVLEATLLLFSGLTAGVAGFVGGSWWTERQAQVQRRRVVRSRAGIVEERKSSEGGVSQAVVRYVVRLSKQLAFKSTRPLIPHRRGARSQESPLRKNEQALSWLAGHALKAGLEGEVSQAGFSEARVRLALMGAAVGGLVGAVLSNELAVLLGLGGFVGGVVAPRWAIGSVEKQRSVEVEQHLSEMLEVVALGLRSGLSFDRSFQLYGEHFNSSLAQACTSAQRRWSLGMTTRDEALRGLAQSYASEHLSRIVENVVRSLRFGSSLVEGLEAAAVQARADHRAHMEERVAKAPVKMMMPTGALILPAMLLLVLGPVLLELGDGF